MRYAWVVLALILVKPADGWWRKIAGVVVDTSGKPIAGARIEHTAANVAYVTDANGRFELQTIASAVVIRKVGFQSHFLRTDGGQNLRIVLEPAYAPVACTLNPVPKAKVSSSQDIDYLSTSYVLETKTGPVAMRCGRGPMWSLGVPNNELVWDSVEYGESVTGAGYGTVDAKGRTADGQYWRYRGMLGDSCEYSKVDRETAAAFDCLLNPPAAK
jgi:hypothetical protein